jgi:FAD/FMN-containing dehydrogenase
MGGLSDDLKRLIKGDVFESDDVLDAASHDASIFEVRPTIVVAPRDVHDLQMLVRYVTRLRYAGRDVSLTVRNGGTCMSGGPLSQSIVVDVSRHLNHIGAVSIAHREVSAQGGVMHIDLEKATHPKGLYFAPYTSSRDICGIGGMIGNNASGEKSVKYGPTSSNINSLNVLLSDGEVYEFSELSVKELDAKRALPTFEGKLYREMTALLDEHWHLIEHNHPNVKKNAAGYPLWDLWDTHKQRFNLGRLFVGSQGTLGIVTDARLKLVPFPKASRMIVVPIEKLSNLAPVVTTMLEFRPTTCETFDWHTYNLAKQYHPEDAARASVADGQHMVVFAIYDGDTQHGADAQAKKAAAALSKDGYSASWIDDPSILESYLLIRRKSFRMLLEHPHGSSRAMPFIEDTIVDIRHYGEFLAALEAVLSEYPLTYTYAGHIGDGSIRLVPLADMERPGAAEMIMEVARRVYDLTFAFGGSMAVDHNDGILKTPFLERMYGADMVTLFARVKELFDPLGIFNPGKKVGGTLDYAVDHIIRKN